jgi:hypothetical protein
MSHDIDPLLSKTNPFDVGRFAIKPLHLSVLQQPIHISFFPCSLSFCVWRVLANCYLLDLGVRLGIFMSAFMSKKNLFNILSSLILNTCPYYSEASSILTPLSRTSLNRDYRCTLYFCYSWSLKRRCGIRPRSIRIRGLTIKAFYVYKYNCLLNNTFTTSYSTTVSRILVSLILL